MSVRSDPAPSHAMGEAEKKSRRSESAAIRGDRCASAMAAGRRVRLLHLRGDGLIALGAVGALGSLLEPARQVLTIDAAALDLAGHCSSTSRC